MLITTLRFSALAAKALFITAACFSAAGHAETCPAVNEFRGPYLISPNFWMFDTASGWRGYVSPQTYPQNSFHLATFQTPDPNEPGLPGCIYDATNRATDLPEETTLAMVKPPGPALTIDTSVANKWRQSAGSDDYACDNNGDESLGPLTQADCPFKPVSPPLSTTSVNPFGKK